MSLKNDIYLQESINNDRINFFYWIIRLISLLQYVHSLVIHGSVLF